MDYILNKIYIGKALEKKAKLPNNELLMPYLPSTDLIEAVNISAMLGRPLLVKGEPGCGKTKLAEAIAYEVHKDEIIQNKYSLDEIYFELHVKSSGKAIDSLYKYDYVKRLQHAQLSSALNKELIEDQKEYIKLGPLGKAFVQSNHYVKPVVILIDEIDKANSDFPNDLLRELDELKFTIDELGETITANKNVKPIIIITSNDEKELPLPFLRRCIFHYISFPSEERLRKIAKAHFSGLVSDSEIIDQVVAVYSHLRTRMDDEKDNREKKVTTSELIDWCSILLKHKPKEIKELLTGKLPYSSILFKNKEDLIKFSSIHSDANNN